MGVLNFKFIFIIVQPMHLLISRRGLLQMGQARVSDPSLVVIDRRQPATSGVLRVVSLKVVVGVVRSILAAHIMEGRRLELFNFLPHGMLLGSLGPREPQVVFIIIGDVVPHEFAEWLMVLIIPESHLVNGGVRLVIGAKLLLRGLLMMHLMNYLFLWEPLS